MQQFDTPMWIRLSVLVIGGLCGLSAPFVGAAAAEGVLNGQTPFLALVAFELLVLGAGVFALLIGLGKFRQAPAVGIACVAGTILVGAALGEPAIGTWLRGQDSPGVTLSNVFGTSYDLELLPVMTGRLAASAVLFLLAALTVLIRHPGTSFRRLGISLVCATPLLFGGVGFVLSRGSASSPQNPNVAEVVPEVGPEASAPAAGAGAGQGSGNVFLMAFLSIFGGLLLIVLVSASGHYLIRAMESGRAEDELTSA